MNNRKAPCARPKTLVCYICGREYGTRSLAIHIKSCVKKWDNEQELLPKNKRRPCPKAPEAFLKYVEVVQGGGKQADMAIKNAGAMLENYNMQAFEKWDTEALIPCKNCGRTFLPSALEHHAKACKKGHVLK
jgi:hypothetical protein